MPALINLLFLFAAASSLLFGACGSNIEESVDTPISVLEQPAGAPISVAELADRIEAGSPPLVLDVRSRREYAQGHIPGAINIPHDELSSRRGELPGAKSEEIVVHCHSGKRAQLAEEMLREIGFSNVRDLLGHWQEWQAARLPVE